MLLLTTPIQDRSSSSCGRCSTTNSGVTSITETHIPCDTCHLIPLLYVCNRQR